jgi:hypothetical protein
MRTLLIAYALVNAVIYSALLPLWEGFDEPFHFGYVQRLANGQGWPDARTARLSGEVYASLLLAPASQAVKQNLPQVTSYSEYFSWPAQRRSEVRRRLDTIPSQLRWQPSELPNYEAHQPPLAYVFLALPERLLSSVQLPVRVMTLRIMAAVAGAWLLLIGAERLFSQLGIPEPYQTIALFCLLSSQMLWATLTHVGNDWLAVPVAVWALVALNRLGSSPGGRTAVLAAVILAAGLLTKAYFLAFIPLLLGICVCRRRWRELAIASVILCGLAGPWYARNLVLYHVLTGTQESRAGIGLPEVMRGAPSMDWTAVISSSVRSSLWNGNNTFSTFSVSTLNLIIGVCLLALLLWAASSHASAEWITFYFCTLFFLALGYATVVSHIYTHGAANGPSPWYAQVLLAPLLGLVLLGLSRSPRLGRFVAAPLVLLFGYVLAATYAVKLIPLYGGDDGRASVAALTSLYGRQLRILSANLNTVTLAPATMIFVLATVIILLVIAQQTILLRCIFGDPSNPLCFSAADETVGWRPSGRFQTHDPESGSRRFRVPRPGEPGRRRRDSSHDRDIYGMAAAGKRLLARVAGEWRTLQSSHFPELLPQPQLVCAADSSFLQ